MTWSIADHMKGDRLFALEPLEVKPSSGGDQFPRQGQITAAGGISGGTDSNEQSDKANHGDLR
ncbi:MAG TPA: hypothetical protein VD867_06110 [Burkholderiales bacterium]|nr:hypothetical protein [Burkholderiales bacterium]